MIGFPVKFRSRLGATWTDGAFAASLHWNHVDAYEDRAGVRIDAWDTADVQASWNPETGALAGLRISLTVQNLLDEDPPFYDAASGFGFDPGQGSLLGRVVALQLVKRW
ncbi:TonB-dependent receptor [Brevundimonas sp.]|uniref:TonB-dependent receptor n=1 Tax=Brevundimonas sp. TaxID=1871086 RepID=UPI0028A0411E|nr:TonB-dependent receptor [Brevundimonas sp.]